LISHLRPSLPIVVATSTERVWRQLNLSWGVSAFILPPCASIEELVERSISYIKDNKIAKKGDRMIVVAGEPVGQAGNVNLVEVRDIK
jgi:pyruvate kinase